MENKKNDDVRPLRSVQFVIITMLFLLVAYFVQASVGLFVVFFAAVSAILSLAAWNVLNIKNLLSIFIVNLVNYLLILFLAKPEEYELCVNIEITFVIITELVGMIWIAMIIRKKIVSS